jgi:type I restriction enzyme S subunit
MMFYKETNFKETPIGKIPKDWEVVMFSDVVNTLPGFAFSSKFFSKEKGIPLIRIRDLGKDSTETFYNGPYEEEYLVEKGDILVSMDGEFNVCLWKGPSGLLNQRVMKIWPKCKEKLDALYLYYVSQKPLKSFEYQIAATTVKHLLTEHFRLIKIPLPTEIKEQQKIAEVLSTIDEAIQKTNEIIAKTERLKKGLMQELLTKGIGHKEFKDTEIGRIPKEWEVVRLETIGDIVNGFAFPIKYQGKKGSKYIFVKVSDTNLPGNEKYIFVTENTIDDEVAEKLGAKIYPPGTLIFPKIGMVIYLRKVRILAKGGTFDNNIMGIVPNEKIMNREFLYYLLLEKIDLTKLVGRTTAPSIRKSEVEKLKIPCPSLSEQQKIAEILSTIDKKLEIERKEKARLERIKQGLMDLLLTGKIRVKVNHIVP